MRKIKICYVIIAAIMGLCTVFSAAGEEPGDQLIEVFKKEIKPKESLVPPGVIISKDYQPGRGKAIGTVKAIKGRVLVIHRDDNIAYILKKKNELFVDDTLISEKGSRVQAEFGDGSIIAVGSYTKLVLDKSVYDPSTSTRDSLIRLLFGKARFLVTKLVNFRNTKYEVKTPTAVLGVRGSDFAVAVSYVNPLMTTVMTNVDTVLGIQGAIGPEVTVGPLQASFCIEGEFASPAADVSEFLIGPDLVLMSANWAPYVITPLVAVPLIAGFSDDSDSGSGSDPATITAVNPPAGSPIIGLTDVPIEFTFSKKMNQTAGDISLSTTGDWIIVGSLSWLSGSTNDSVVVTVRDPISSIPTDPFDLLLTGFVDSDGIPLPPTQFTFNGG